ncbi:MAG: serine phosphatase, partial [Candidatus Solibacter sp.]|nr:serine phosphatase [Candidatus Solibacter sp.]
IYNAVRDVAASVDYNAAQWPPLLPDLLLTVLTMTAVGVFFMAQLTEDLLGVVGTNVNRLVYDASPENRYATFFYCQFDPATRMLVYTNGGHNPPILLRGSEVIRLEIGGPPVGLFRPAHYQQAEVQLEPADLILFYTDGISEAENSAADEWGEDALIAAARSCHDRPPAEMITRIISAADTFADGAPQHDDMTLVVARVV